MSNAAHNQSLERLDQERLFHPVSSIADIAKNGPMVIGRAKGATVADIHGTEFIDCGAGLWCANIGYGRPEMAETAKRATEELSYFHMFAGASNEHAIRLADRLIRTFQDDTPAKRLSRVFYGQSGSDANDTNAKIVRYYNNLRGRPEKKKILAREGGYHGLTMASGGLTGIPAYHKAFDLPGPDVIHLSCPHFYRLHEEGEDEAVYTARLLAELEAVIAREGADTIAAFIAEPVMGTGGVFTPPAGYFEGVQKILKANDILFIADEVITGFGRLGDWSATKTYNLDPDIVTLAKGITSAYFPLSASVLSEEIWSVLEDASAEMGPLMHGFTYSGHPVGCAMAMTNLDILDGEGLVENAAARGAQLLKRLREETADHPYVGDVRGEGFMIGVEYVADRETRRAFPAGSGPHKLVSAACKEEGLLSRALPYLEVMAFSPPLSMSEAEVEEAVRRFKAGLYRATPALRDLDTEGSAA